jgi:excisionase family DNA binding protein
MEALSDTLLDDLADRIASRLAVRMQHPPSAGSPGSGAEDARPPSEWLTAAEAAKFLGFDSMKAFYSAVERRQVPASRLGRRLRFHRAGLDRLLAGRAVRMAGRVPSPGKESERWSS